MILKYDAEWEWGWKTPLLFRLQDDLPAPVRAFLETPLERFDFPRAEAEFTARLKEMRNYRIGFRFERVQAALFAAHPDTESLRTSLVIPGRTEIDLLHRLQSLPRTILHWEVAVKFYLALDEAGSRDPDRFVGPSLHDTLGIKSRTIFGRQLPVLADPEVRAKFGPAFGIERDESVLALPKVHGLLFDPFEADQAGQTTPLRPNAIAEKTLKGVWAPIERLADLVEHFRKLDSPGGEGRLRVLFDRRDWIRDQRRIPVGSGAEIPLKGHFQTSLFEGLQSHFMNAGEPLQGAFLGGTVEAPTEIRFFLVPTGWRDSAERELETLRREGRIEA